MTPVVLILFNRANMARRMLSSFAAADDAGERDVFVFMDGPRNELERAKCDDVARVVQDFRGVFPRMQLIRRNCNIGCRANIVDAVTTVMRKFGRAIVIEDDILISRTFLRYMDNALEFYKDDSRIWCINGFRNLGIHVPHDYKGDVYLDRRNWSWGWGGWYDRWSQVDFDMKFWPQCRESPESIKQLDDCGLELRPMAEGQYSGRLNTWDIQCTVHVVLNGLFVIEPKVLLSKSIGFDSESTHTSAANPILATAPYYNFLPKLTKNLMPDDRILRQLRTATFDPRLSTRIIRKLHRIYASFKKEQYEPIEASEMV